MRLIFIFGAVISKIRINLHFATLTSIAPLVQKLCILYCSRAASIIRDYMVDFAIIYAKNLIPAVFTNIAGIE